MTSERHDMHRDPVTSRHRARYSAFAPWYRGDVIDLGSGTGYGATIIGASSRVTSILTVDRQPVPQTYVPTDVTHDTLTGTIPACLSRLGDECADVVSAIEFVEHLTVEDQASLYRHAHRLLRPDGFILLSTPSVKQSGPSSTNPWHLWELNRADADAALSAAGFRVEASFDVDMGALSDGLQTPIAFIVGRKACT